MVGNGDVLLDLLDVAGVDGTKAIIMAVDGALLHVVELAAILEQ